MTDVAVVTGASSGLGLEIANILRETMAVVGVSRRGPDVRSDASDPATAAAALNAAQKLGAVRLLVNCAGVGIYKPIGSYSTADIAATLNANLIATIVFCERFLPVFMRDGGTVVNVLSTAALVGKAKESVYCAAKWGGRGYTEALRAETKGTKVRILAVYPGGMDTAFWDPPRESFMPPRDVAAMIVDALLRPGSIAVTELVISRPEAPS